MLGTVRGVTSVYTDLGISERSWRDRRPDRRLYNIAVDRIDRYICLSEAAAAPVRRDYGRDVEVLGGGVDMNAFTPAPTRETVPTLLFPSAVEEPRKNFPLLLNAFGLLRARKPNVQLWIAGPGDPSTALASASAAARDGVVPLGVGELADLPTLYGRAWATVLPSSGEAFGIVVLESLACGTPVVTLDEGGASELVNDGVGARSAPTPASLADACERALALAEQTDIAARCREAARPHDWRGGVVPRLERIYEGAR
jgi:glycosyltransferase involved in cell wall biosynthesis